MNYKIKCLICKSPKWFSWGKFCPKCLEENYECISSCNVSILGRKLGNSDWVIINKSKEYQEATSDKPTELLVMTPPPNYSGDPQKNAPPNLITPEAQKSYHRFRTGQ